MTPHDLVQVLTAAGFAGVEVADGLVYARLTAADGEFTARPVAGTCELTLCRAVRAADWQMAEWAVHHPDAPLDLWQGETRLRLLMAPDIAALARWAALAEDFVLASTRWRKGQRDRGEGW